MRSRRRWDFPIREAQLRLQSGADVASFQNDMIQRVRLLLVEVRWRFSSELAPASAWCSSESAASAVVSASSSYEASVGASGMPRGRPLPHVVAQRRDMGVRPLMQLQADMVAYVQLLHSELSKKCLAMSPAVGSALPSSQHSAALPRAAAVGKADRSMEFQCRGCGTLKGACPEWTKWNGSTCPICVSASRNQLKGIDLPVRGPHAEYEKHAKEQRLILQERAMLDSFFMAQRHVMSMSWPSYALYGLLWRM